MAWIVTAYPVRPWRLRITIVAIAVSLAVGVRAQTNLSSDLDRADARYEPAATIAPSEVDRLTQQAGEHLRGSRVDDAVAALDRAAGLAYRSGATGRAFELSLTAAEALRAAGQLTESAERFQHAALQNPSDPRASAAHYTACEAVAAQLADTPESLDEYGKMLSEHLATWPGTPSAESVEWQVVELAARRGRWGEVLEAVRPITAVDDHYARAVDLKVAGHAALLGDRATPDRFSGARIDLEPLFLHAPTPWPINWAPIQRKAALTLALAALDLRGQGIDEYARPLLRTSVRGRPAAPDQWRRRAVAALVVAALAAGDGPAAAEWMDGLFDGVPEERRRLLGVTAQRVAQASGALSDEVDRLAESVAALSGNASDSQTATALIDAGRDDAARQLYQRLAAESPDDRSVLIEYARLLSKSDSREEVDRALTLWGRIESRSKPASDRWFEARVARIETLARLGRREDARKLLAITRVLAPSLGGPAWAERFGSLAKSLE